MPKPRAVKPWTIYPPTQEDRTIIEQKAQAAGLSVSSYLCMVGKLACINVGLSTEQHQQKVLSEPEPTPKSAEPVPAQKKPSEQEPTSKPEPVAKPTFEFYGLDGKPLSPSAVETVCEERNNGRVELVSSNQGKDASKRMRYKCTATGFLFDVIAKPTV